MDVSPSSLFNLLKFSELPLLLDFRSHASFSRCRLRDAIHLNVSSLFSADGAEASAGIRQDLILDTLGKLISNSSELRRFNTRRGSDIIIVVDPIQEEGIKETNQMVDIVRGTVHTLMLEGIVKSVRIFYGHEKFQKDFGFLCVHSNGVMVHPLYPARRPAAYPSEIVPGFLYLGSVPEASCMHALADLGVGYVLNTAAQCGDKNKGVFVYCKLDLLDRRDTDIAKHFEAAFEFINTAKRSHAAVVVHCQAGVSRSATIVIAYLMKELGWNLQTAFDHVKQCRPIIRPNKGFLQSLESYDEFLKEQGSSGSEGSEGEREADERGNTSSCFRKTR